LPFCERLAEPNAADTLLHLPSSQPVRSAASKLASACFQSASACFETTFTAGAAAPPELPSRSTASGVVAAPDADFDEPPHAATKTSAATALAEAPEDDFREWVRLIARRSYSSSSARLICAATGSATFCCT
jgi:hypothetical protein